MVKVVWRLSTLAARCSEELDRKAMTEDWETAKRRYPIGSTVTGKVDRVAGFGVFLAVEGLSRYGAVVDVVGLRTDAEGSAVWPEPGESVTGVVVDHMEHNQKIKLALS
ncbi:hypothetical protein ACIBKX_11930 [Streptomyces sp. NPDC050658]|uniref:hypothetical protein n=1 Tax=unclassified Streptomyces TaxID=2593676 RepID=UPI00342492D6